MRWFVIVKIENRFTSKATFGLAGADLNGRDGHGVIGLMGGA